MISALAIAMLAASSGANASAAQAPALQCNIGPTTAQLGGNDWLMYGCADGHSVVVVAAPPNPASPFVFIVTPDGNGGIELHGEGTGSKSATEPAYKTLSSMSSADLEAFYQQARHAADK
jgi:hypothetical protein